MCICICVYIYIYIWGIASYTTPSGVVVVVVVVYKVASSSPAPRIWSCESWEAPSTRFVIILFIDSGRPSLVHTHESPGAQQPQRADHLESAGAGSHSTQTTVSIIIICIISLYHIILYYAML